MNKHELKSLLENIYEAMILPSLADQALSDPSLLNPTLSKPFTNPNLLGTTPYPTNDPINEPTNEWLRANGWETRWEYDEWMRIDNIMRGLYAQGGGGNLTQKELDFHLDVRLRRERRFGPTRQ